LIEDRFLSILRNRVTDRLSIRLFTALINMRRCIRNRNFEMYLIKIVEYMVYGALKF